MSNKIYGLTKDHLPQRFRRFFIPGDVILFSPEWENPPPDADATPSSSSANSNASPSNDDDNGGTHGPEISCFSCLLDKCLCYIVLVLSGAILFILNYLLGPKHIAFLAWSPFSSLSALISTISSAPTSSLLTSLILLSLPSLHLASLYLLLTHTFESTAAWQQPPSHIHAHHLIDRLLLPVLPRRPHHFLTAWLRNAETLQEMYSNLYGSNRHDKINRYIRQDPTQRFHPMEEFRHLLFQHPAADDYNDYNDYNDNDDDEDDDDEDDDVVVRWIVVRLAPYPLSFGQKFCLSHIPSSAFRQCLRDFHQTYHYWQRTLAADGAFAVLDNEFEEQEQEYTYDLENDDDDDNYPICLLDALFFPAQNDDGVDRRPKEHGRLYLNATAAGYGFFPRPTAESDVGSRFARDPGNYSLSWLT